FVQPSGVPVLERLGVLAQLEEHGAYRGGIDVWSPAGWVSREGEAQARALSVRRAVLDPVLRARAAATPGVDLLLGSALTALEPDGERTRVTAGSHALRARLVVGADGRRSRTAALAGLPTRRSENRRFAYWAYYAPDAPVERARVWFA